MDIITWETIGLIIGIISSVVAVLAKLNEVENNYNKGQEKQRNLENQLLATSKNLEIQKKETDRLKAQVGREFNNIAWQLRIIIGSLKDIENFLEKSSGYSRRKMSEEEDTRGFMLKKVKELDSPDEEEEQN
ncbi:hypothetical protein [Laspinema olomoucense]|uniref:hypothetical protein n=1 Tax=Laspinema olomoucense TaxID=3231600 RepID=UPI0021BA764C|nr:hypothetical protein [Laspinema sp. D3d]MCT7971085.1 hypothetical protein [Laspinema sp. D3d]